jgi:branched-chain amino acid transport system permease protein
LALRPRTEWLANSAALAPAGSGIGVAVLAILVLTGLGGSYEGSTFTIALGYAVVTVGMSIQLGFSRQLAFSQSAFMGVGGYTSAILETKYAVPTAGAVLAAVVVAAVLSLVLSAVLTRVAGLALALVTLLIPQLVYQVATFSHYLGSFSGLSGVAPLWSAESYQQSLLGTGYIAALVLGLVTYLALRVLRSDVGLQLAAVAANEGMAQGLGVDLGQRKREVFVFGSVLAALGGAIVAGAQNIVTPDLVSEAAQLTLLVMLFVGGRRSILGAILGAVAIQYLSSLSDAVTSNLAVIEGVLLLLVLLFEPDGVARIVGRLGHGLRRRLRRDEPEPEPAAPRPTPVTSTVGGESGD